MSVTRLGEEAVLYPAVFIWQRGFRVWRRGAVILESDMKGLLVDRQGKAFWIVGAERPPAWSEPVTTRAERRQLMHEGRWPLRGPGGTLIYEGNSFTMTADEVRDRIAWLVSASWNYESANPMGVPLTSTAENAGSVEELLQALPTGHVW